ncbi:MAG: HAD family hydrolase [Chthoniobacterales bacterium]
MIKAAIFDLDGTLVDSNDLHVEAWQETFRHFGKEFPVADLRKQIGKGGDQYLPEFLNEFELRTLWPEIEKFRGELFKKKYLERVRPFPKVRELFQRVRNDGQRIALASSGNGNEVEHYMELAEIADLVKPQPDIFLRALNLLGRAPDEAIAIGDAFAAFLSAPNAGDLRLASTQFSGDKRFPWQATLAHEPRNFWNDPNLTHHRHRPRQPESLQSGGDRQARRESAAGAVV